MAESGHSAACVATGAAEAPLMRLVLADGMMGTECVYGGGHVAAAASAAAEQDLPRRPGSSGRGREAAEPERAE
eukprot:113004-Pelagomonas_calceolata.AAC.5